MRRRELSHPTLHKLRMVVAATIIIMIILGIAFAFGMSSVEVGEAAVIVDPIQQRIVDIKFGPQLFIKFPWQYVIKVYTAVDAITMRKEIPHDYPAVSALTKDGAKVEVDITVRYKIIESFRAVESLIKSYPMLNYKSITIVPTIREVVRNIIANFTLTEVIEKRSKIGVLIVEAATKRLITDPTLKNCIEIIDVAVRNIEPPSEVVAAINRKLAAEQEAKAAEYNKTKILILANASAMEKRIAAQAEAIAILLRAEAEAKAVLLRANATSASLRMIAEVLGVNNTNALVNYLYLETLKSIVEKEGARVVLIIGGAQGLQTPVIYPLPIETTREKRG